ncbi:MAG: methanogen output domain 1-containing protein [Methanosarcinales archaeon]
MQIKTVLTNVIPLLVASAPATNRNMFIKEMCNQVEGVLWNKYLSKFKEVDRNILGNCLCKIMNELGGKFEVHKILDKKLFIKGTVCPWDMEAKRNPVLCMLCKCIFSRLAVKVFNKVIIDLNKTLGNKDEHCLIIISEY